MANGDVVLDEFVFSGLDMTIMGLHIFGFLGVRQFFLFTVIKRTRMFVLQLKNKVFFIQSKKNCQFIKIESD